MLGSNVRTIMHTFVGDDVIVVYTFLFVRLSEMRLQLISFTCL